MWAMGGMLQANVGSFVVKTSETCRGTRMPRLARNCCTAAKERCFVDKHRSGRCDAEQRIQQLLQAFGRFLPVRQIIVAGRNSVRREFIQNGLLGDSGRGLAPFAAAQADNPPVSQRQQTTRGFDACGVSGRPGGGNGQSVPVAEQRKRGHRLRAELLQHFTRAGGDDPRIGLGFANETADAPHIHYEIHECLSGEKGGMPGALNQMMQFDRGTLGAPVPIRCAGARRSGPQW